MKTPDLQEIRCLSLVAPERIDAALGSAGQWKVRQGGSSGANSGQAQSPASALATTRDIATAGELEQAFAEELHQNSICRCAQTAISALSLDVREPPDLTAGDPLRPVSTLERVELVLSGDVVCVQVGHTAPVADVKYSIRQLQGDSRE